MLPLKHLFEPGSVAVVGASAKPGKVGYEILHNLLSNDFKGDVVPVNPKEKEILGKKCCSSLQNCDIKIDLCIISIPAKAVLEAVKDALGTRVKSICIISAGFKETGKEGAKLEKEIADMCRAKKVRLMGPNCLGLLNTDNNMNASFAKHMPKKGNISVISQSGALCTAILDRAAGSHLGLAKLVSMGNKSDLNETDFLDHFREDNQTIAVAGYLESIEDGDKFIKAAKSLSEKKPLIILKSGITSAGGRAASSHTGSLAGTDTAYGSAFKRSGVIRADTFEQLFDYSIAFATQPLPKGRKVAIITNAGGPGIMAADAAELNGLEVCTLEGASATALRKKLPAAASVGNPIDVLGDADPERYATAIKAAIDDECINAIIVILTPQSMTKPEETAREIAKCANKSKPILASFMGGEDVLPAKEELMELNLPDYSAPERAIEALKAMCDYSDWQSRPPRIVNRFPVHRRKAERIIRHSLNSNRTQLRENEAKIILQAYGFNISPGKLVFDRDECLSSAEKIGFPLAMKIVSKDIIHKSDVGGVKLNINSYEELKDAYDLMLLRIKEQMPDAVIDGVYIEKMCSPGREIIIGMTRDPQFGPMLMFGLGGIFVEVMKDVSFHIAPITEEEAVQMLEKTKSFALLKGVRGQGSFDMKAIVNSLQRISQLVTDFPQITEMDINPFIVGKIGSASFAADARMTLSTKVN